MDRGFVGEFEIRVLTLVDGRRVVGHDGRRAEGHQIVYGAGILGGILVGVSVLVELFGAAGPSVISLLLLDIRVSGRSRLVAFYVASCRIASVVIGALALCTVWRSIVIRESALMINWFEILILECSTIIVGSFLGMMPAFGAARQGHVHIALQMA